MGIGRPVSLTGNIASKIVSATATAGQTSFTVTGGYNINQLAVFRNGVRLVNGSDYTAIDGATVTLLSAANLNDTLEFQVFDNFQVSDAILKASSSQTIDGSLSAVGGFNIGIQSAGTNVTTGVVTAFNFVGSGNTFLYDADAKTVDISISGSGGGGGLGTAINYADATTTPFSYIDYEALVKDNITDSAVRRLMVEAGEHLGFLAGDLKDKVDPYLTHLYDALNDMIQKDKLKYYLDNKIIEIAPLAYMRGRTLHNSFIILDEAQNSTQMQMKMFLTRIGVTSKAIITGDITQIDLEGQSMSGLIHATNILKKIKGIAFIHFNENDVIRHQLVKNIIKAYSKEEK